MSSQSPSGGSSPPGGASEGSGLQRGVRGLRLAAAVILLFSVVVLIQAILIGAEGGFGPEGSGFFPLIVTVGFVVFAALFLLQTTLRPDPALREHVAAEEEVTNWSTVGLMAAALLVYALLLAPLGYPVATVLLFFAMARILGSRSWVRDLIIGVVLSAVIFVGFEQFLGVRLPTGVLGVIL